MKETPEQLAQRIQDARGYIIIRSPIDFPVGHIFLGASSGSAGDLNCKLVAIAKTDFADWEAQHDFADPDRRYVPVKAPFYFRVIAE